MSKRLFLRLVNGWKEPSVFKFVEDIGGIYLYQYSILFELRSVEKGILFITAERTRSRAILDCAGGSTG